MAMLWNLCAHILKKKGDDKTRALSVTVYWWVINMGFWKFKFFSSAVGCCITEYILEHPYHLVLTWPLVLSPRHLNCSCAVTSRKCALFTLLPGELVKRSCPFRSIIAKEARNSQCSDFSHISHLSFSQIKNLWPLILQEERRNSCLFFREPLHVIKTAHCGVRSVFTKPAGCWLTGWISGWCRTAADVCVIRMIHPHSLYKRISPQVTGHLYEKDMAHRDLMVCSASVPTHVTIQEKSVKSGLADQVSLWCCLRVKTLSVNNNFLYKQKYFHDKFFCQNRLSEVALVNFFILSYGKFTVILCSTLLLCC